MATFFVHKAEDDTKVFKLEKPHITLGRRGDNDIVLEDIYVSRAHAAVEKKGVFYYIRDQHSRYGTFVNGTRVTETRLDYGDEIQLGNTVITFVDENKLDQVPTPKKPARLIGTNVDIPAKIESIRNELNEGASADGILKSLGEIENQFKQYRENLVEVEKIKEIASTLCEVGKIINFVFDLNVLLNLLMDLAIKIMQARRGFIMLYDKGSNSLKIKVARNMGGVLDPDKTREISQGIAWQSFKSGKLINTEDATRDPRFMTQESVISYAIGSVVCVPLISKEKERIGVIYLDNPVAQKKFDRDDIEFMLSFANQAAIAIENAQLYEKVKEEERIRERLQRFFSPGVVGEIMSDKRSVTLGGENRTATILFSDIRGFTSLTERIPTVTSVEILNDFLSSMSEEVFNQDGTLDKYIGDCVMAIFGAPVAHPDDALRAIKAALGMKKRVQQLRAQWHDKIDASMLEVFEIGIGIHTGEVIAGNIGSIERMEYTVVGTAVNIASRLESVAKPGQILISRSTYACTKDSIEATKLPPVELKNVSRPVEVFEVTGLLS
ncbi:MAG: GAF domain-containing protein [candidate division WOR-3 bacterium]|nr:MAG: GAF domain-containing protein [candidate division WOR-3 bacterium]